MYTKALTFNDDDIAEQILDSEDPDEINELGRQVSGYDDVIWNGLRQAVVYEGLKIKFEQDDELCSRLLSTDDVLLAECTVKNISGALDYQYSMLIEEILIVGKVKIF